MRTVSLTCPHCGTLLHEQARACPVCGRASRGEPESIAAARPGSLLGGRYSVVRLLSRGGMGALYLADDRESGGRVVVKSLGDYFDPCDDREAAAARERLANEARLLASLSHPAIPRFIGSFQEGVRVYVVMEYIAGVDLQQRLTAGGAEGRPGSPYPRTDVLRWGVALCRVLEYLASRPQPLVHHDIKPANLLVDQSGDRIYLVDFGAAQARRRRAENTGRGGAYGTVGYAPPEQYRGHSDPKSDVYALAATLYHLATDDDPGDHPFSFPRLGELGPLGETLARALDRDARRRPPARALRERLEELLAAAGGALLRAPDGTWLPDRQALVAWCLSHWGAAASWLYAGLPEQIELWWGDASLARALRSARQMPDRGLGLDAALAQIDPRGLGRERPVLAADAAEVDFGTLPGEVLRRDVTIVNSGRRFASLYVHLPRWLRGSCSKLALAPGERATLSLSPDLGRVFLGGRLRGEVVVRGRSGSGSWNAPTLRVAAHGRVPLRSALARYRRLLGGAGVALLLWAGSGFSHPLPPDTATFQARIAQAQAALPPAGDARDLALLHAEDSFRRGDYRASLELLSRYADDPRARRLLDDSARRLASAALRRGDWEEARAALRLLLEDDPRHPEARALLRETYYRAAEAARQRGDLAGARAELEALLEHFRGDQTARRLLREILQLQRAERGAGAARP